MTTAEIIKANCELTQKLTDALIEIDRLKAEVERLRSLCGEWLDFTENVFPSCAAGWDQLTALRRRTSEAAGRGEGKA